MSPTSGIVGIVHAGSSGTSTFNVANGPGANEVTSAVKTGSHCAEFQLTTPASLPRTIPGGSNENWVITFTPTAGNRGARSCLFTFDDQDGNGDSYGVSGTASQPNMRVSTTSLAFGSIALTATRTDTVAITNLAPSNEILDYIVTLSGAHPTDFTVSPSCQQPCMVPVGSTQKLVVSFTPGGLGPRSATLTIQGDDAGNPSDAVTLTGTGSESVGVGLESASAEKPWLAPPSPNPSAEGSAVFAFRLAQPGLVSLRIADLAGRPVTQSPPTWFPAGSHALPWQLPGGSAGIYFVRLTTGTGEAVVRKWIVLR